MQRRAFLQKAGLGSLLLTSGQFPLHAFGSKDPDLDQLTILHTNDVHSRIEAFPQDGGKYAGRGGAARRAALLARIRSESEHVLLLDAGDIFQGTPYFNIYRGELEFKLMSQMGYDAATIGNHDFDAGLEGLEKQLGHADFPLLSANYDFSDTILQGKTLPYQIFKKGRLRIGVFGMGIELEGLVPRSLFGSTRYEDPLQIAQQMERLLQRKGCDFIICLSHLGYQYRENKISDIYLAKHTRHTDLIIGGHTHTFLDEPTLVSNLSARPVMVNQVGWAGIVLGRIDVFFERNRKDRCVTCQNLITGIS